MNKHIVILIIAVALLASCRSQRQTLVAPEGMSRELQAAGLNVSPLSEGQQTKWLGALSKTYTSWQSMSMDGKLSMKELPLDPSLKLYMERGRLIIISMRVPLMGELGRIELAPDTCVIINRHNKCYARIPSSQLFERAGVSLNDAQDLLLGRVFMAGGTPLTEDSASLFRVSEGAGDTYIVTPVTERTDAQYGFTLYPDGKMLLAVAFSELQHVMVQSQYSYSGANTSLDISITAGEKQYGGILSYGKVQINPSTALSRADLNSKWEEVTFKNLLKTF